MATALLGGVACTSEGGGGGDSTSSTGSTTSAMTTAATESESETSTLGEAGDSPTTDPSTGGSFYAGPDDSWDLPVDCDPWLQDCPDGEKCVAYGSTGGNWNANKCVPILGDGQAGDACHYDGTYSGTDDCDGDHWCWNVGDQSMGTCAPLCTGTPDDPQCDPGFACVVANEGSITVCIEACDPLGQDCAEGTACYWHSASFSCAFTTEDLPTGSSCGYVNDCAPGNFCGEDLLDGCAGDACCVAFCAIDDPDACPDPDLACVPFFDEDLALPGFENLGGCVTGP